MRVSPSAAVGWQGMSEPLSSANAIWCCRILCRSQVQGAQTRSRALGIQNLLEPPAHKAEGLARNTKCLRLAVMTKKQKSEGPLQSPCSRGRVHIPRGGWPSDARCPRSEAVQLHLKVYGTCTLSPLTVSRKHHREHLRHRSRCRTHLIQARK